MLRSRHGRSRQSGWHFLPVGPPTPEQATIRSDIEHDSGAWLADQLSRLELRYPEIRVFADSRRFAEDWTHRFLSSALAGAGGESEQ
jgi:hypothetical protein